LLPVVLPPAGTGQVADNYLSLMEMIGFCKMFTCEEKNHVHKLFPLMETFYLIDFIFQQKAR
jgi:hypothetical protein